MSRPSSSHGPQNPHGRLAVLNSCRSTVLKTVLCVQPSYGRKCVRKPRVPTPAPPPSALWHDASDYTSAHHRARRLKLHKCHPEGSKATSSCWQMTYTHNACNPPNIIITWRAVHYTCTATLVCELMGAPCDEKLASRLGDTSIKAAAHVNTPVHATPCVLLLHAMYLPVPWHDDDLHCRRRSSVRHRSCM